MDKLEKAQDVLELMIQVKTRKDHELSRITQFIKDHYLSGYRINYKSNSSCTDYVDMELISYGLLGELVWSCVKDMYSGYSKTQGFDIGRHEFHCPEGFNEDTCTPEPFSAVLEVTTIEWRGGFEREGKDIDFYDMSDIIKMENENPTYTLRDQIKKCEKDIERIEWEIKKQLNK